MKFARLVALTALIVFAISLSQTVLSQQPSLAQKGSRATQVYRPRINVATEGPISFEEFPAVSPDRGMPALITNQYEEARGIVFNDAGISVYEGFAHTGKNAISRCAGVEVVCDPQFVMKFPSKPQKRVKVWFGYWGRVPRDARVVLKVFDAAGTKIGEDSALLAMSDKSVPIINPLEVTLESIQIDHATVGFEENVRDLPGLVLDDIEFDDLLPQPDLTLENLQASVGLDRQLVITVDVRNIGKGASIPTTFELSAPDLWDTPPNKEVPAVEPGKQVPVNLMALIPATARGSAYLYLVVVDPKQETRDINRENNSKRDRFVISTGKPDLNVKILNSGINSYKNAFVVAEIKNVGTAPSTTTTVNIESYGERIGSSSVEPLQPKGSLEVTILLARKLSPGTHPLQAVVNPDKTLDEADLTNNSALGSIVIPRDWWTRPDVLFPTGICVLVVGLYLTYTLVKRRPGRPVIRDPAPPGGQQPTQPNPPVPTFGARPIFDEGHQELALNPAQASAPALGVRPKFGNSSTQIFDGTNPAHKGEA